MTRRRRRASALLLLVPPQVWSLQPTPTTPHLGDLLGASLETDMRIVSELRLSPMQRVAVTANGNLQRILSAYHNEPVLVDVRRNERVKKGLYQRDVVLKIGQTECCFATSLVTCHSDDATHLVDSGAVGIAQLFERLGELPKFSLATIETNSTTLSRAYTLASKTIVCDIHEAMPLTLFDNDFLSRREGWTTTHSFI